jgi:hypothetical protein
MSRPAEVDAIQLDDDNGPEVAEWAGGRLDADVLGHPVVHLPATPIPVRVGDWAIRDVLPDGLGTARAMLDHLMRWAYQPIGNPRRFRRKDAL